MLHSSEISGTTGVLGLIGNPVRHTLSPVIHNTLSEELGRNMAYLPFPVEEDPVKAVEGAWHLGIRGLNVTVPHKTAVIPALKEIDAAAKMIGAVNTLVRAEDGFKGYNTDMPGLGRALARQGVRLKDKQVVILGAGGASRAAVALALSEGAEAVYLLNRTKEKAEQLAEEISRAFSETDGAGDAEGAGNTAGTGTFPAVIPLGIDAYDRVPEKKSVFLQCTSLGLHEGDGLLIDDDSFYRKAEFGFDLVYNPAVTPFMRKLTSLGIPCSNGLDMLLYQGIIAYELWTGASVPDELADLVRSRLLRKLFGGNIILVGYMGCGKSTVGRALAETHAMDFLDTDALIVEEQGRPISEIFAEQGEEAFRDMETELLRRLARERVNTVIATGGGMVLRKENRRLLRAMGTVFWLRASEETTFQRVKQDTGRPLLMSAEDEEALKTRIRSMLKERGAAYEAAADAEIPVDDRSPRSISEEIYSCFSK